MMLRAAAVALALAGSAEAFSLRMSVDALKQTHATCLGKLTERLGLEASDYTDSLGLRTFNVGGVAGEAQWLKEASPKLLTGVSSSIVEFGGGAELRLEAWMGPSYEVPHMLLKLRAPPMGSCEIVADYVSRNDIAYCSDSYRELHYGPDVMNWWAKASQSGLACAPPAAWQGRLLSSPASLNVALQSPDFVAELANEHVDRWLSWLTNAEPLQARRRGAMNSRDDSLRRFAYANNVAEMLRVAGNDGGPQLAAAITGPVSEAYVGGAS